MAGGGERRKDKLFMVVDVDSRGRAEVLGDYGWDFWFAAIVHIVGDRKS